MKPNSISQRFHKLLHEVINSNHKLQAENKVLKQCLYWLKENRPEVLEDMKKAIEQ